MACEIPYKRRRIELSTNDDDDDDNNYQYKSHSTVDCLTSDVLANIFTYLPLSERLKMDYGNNNDNLKFYFL